MREIKFRAWDVTQKLMYSMDELLDPSHIHPSVLIDCLQQPGDGYDTDTVLMQYTGLKDKNGVEIFEGDIVHIFGTHVSYEVKFEKGMWTLGADDLYGYANRSDLYGTEVIGNIYENKELLK